MKNRFFPSLYMGAALAFLLSCEQAPTRVTGGGSSETTNGLTVTGSVFYPDNSVPEGARVFLRPRSFLRDTTQAPLSKTMGATLEARVSATGEYRFDSVGRGEYLMEITDGQGNGALIECDLNWNLKRIDFPPSRLKPTGAIAGVISITSEQSSGAYVQIYGLDRVVRTHPQSGEYLIEDLAEGKYTLRALTSIPQNDPHVLPGIKVQSAITARADSVKLASFEEEDYALWPFTRQIHLNTTSSGADVSEGVADFPLLVRLNAGNFDFTQSEREGIRFSGMAGNRLRYEIERWDAVERRAEIWVRVDSVHAASNRQYINLHWGRGGVPDWSDGRAVFDTALGYAGIWHLHESAVDTLSDNLYKDASPGGNHGDDRIAGPSAQGLIAEGASLAKGDHIRMVQPGSVLRPEKQVTLSGWVKVGATDVGGGTIATMGDTYGLRVDPSGGIRFFFFDGKDWPVLFTRNVYIKDTSWHHCVGVHTGSALEIYVDGKLKESMPVSGAMVYTLGSNFQIGRHGDNKTIYDFTGHLDEVRVSRLARSPAWIKLSFENQRLNQTLLEFR